MEFGVWFHGVKDGGTYRPGEWAAAGWEDVHPGEAEACQEETQSAAEAILAEWETGGERTEQEEQKKQEVHCGHYEWAEQEEK